MTTSDIVVIGAGLAGAAAATRLRDHGLTVTILEARDRVGGRAFCRPSDIAPSAGPLEFGGAWITPWHTRIRSLVHQHGLSLRPRHDVLKRVWLRDGVPCEDGPTSAADRLAHEHAIARVAIDATLIKQGRETNERDQLITQISFADYLDRLAAPDATRDLFSAWWTVSGNGPHDKVLASEFLASCSYGGGLAEGMVDSWVETVSPGMDVLIERMISASGALLRLDTPVIALTQNNDGVMVTTSNESITAQACIAAIGVNQLSGVAFNPSLTPTQTQTVTIGHKGSAFKVWANVNNVEVGTLAVGGGSGIELAFVERPCDDGSALVVGFGLQNAENHPESEDWVRREIQKFFPQVNVLGHDWHDWVSDPYAQGTWVATPTDQAAKFDSKTWSAQGHDGNRKGGRIAFATSDIAREQAGWFEAAVISGEDAADALNDVIG